MKKLLYTVSITLLVLAGYFSLALEVPSIGMDTRELFKIISFSKDQYEDAKEIIVSIQEETNDSNDISENDTQISNNEIKKIIGTSKYETVKVTYIDVGQGDAVLIENEGQFMLIDTGAYFACDNLFTVLDEYGVKTIDALVLTHNDSDHIGNADEVIYNYIINRLYMTENEKDTNAYKNLVTAIAAKEGGSNLKVSFPTLGEKIPLGNIVFDCLGPISDANYEDINSYSIILKLVNGNDSFLFTGDATGEEIEDCIARGADFSAEVLKLAHHGSANCGCNSYNFLRNVDATVYVVSCGLDNKYGHPHMETMQYADQNAIHLYRTDLQGSIVCISYGNKLVWNKNYSTNYTNGNNL